MMQINIPFDSIDYTINQESLTPFVSELSAHMLDELKGSGATIQFNGASYNIDSNKLAIEKSDLITHIGTLAGSGRTVRINDVSYGVDAIKLRPAITEIHTVLQGWQTSNPDTPDEPDTPVEGNFVPFFADGQTWNDEYVELTMEAQDVYGEMRVSPTNEYQFLWNGEICESSFTEDPDYRDYCEVVLPTDGGELVYVMFVRGEEGQYEYASIYAVAPFTSDVNVSGRLTMLSFQPTNNDDNDEESTYGWVLMDRSGQYLNNQYIDSSSTHVQGDFIASRTQAYKFYWNNELCTITTFDYNISDGETYIYLNAPDGTSLNISWSGRDNSIDDGIWISVPDGVTGDLTAMCCYTDESFEMENDQLIWTPVFGDKWCGETVEFTTEEGGYWYRVALPASEVSVINESSANLYRVVADGITYSYIGDYYDCIGESYGEPYLYCEFEGYDSDWNSYRLTIDFNSYDNCYYLSRDNADDESAPFNSFSFESAEFIQ